MLQKIESQSDKQRLLLLDETWAQSKGIDLNFFYVARNILIASLEENGHSDDCFFVDCKDDPAFLVCHRQTCSWSRQVVLSTLLASDEQVAEQCLGALLLRDEFQNIEEILLTQSHAGHSTVIENVCSRAEIARTVTTSEDTIVLPRAECSPQSEKRNRKNAAHFELCATYYTELMYAVVANPLAKMSPETNLKLSCSYEAKPFVLSDLDSVYVGYWERYDLLAGVPSSFRYLIEKGNASSVYSRDTGTLAAWGFHTDHGMMLNAHTVEEHRNRGLYTYLCSLRAAKIQRLGYVPYIFATENAGSTKVFTHQLGQAAVPSPVGFWKLALADWARRCTRTMRRIGAM